MRFGLWVRQGHRWLAIAFTLGVLAYIVAMRGGGQPPAWLGLLALVPLILLSVSGLYLFALPYVVGARKAGA
ncbi:hypothetical protein RZN05_09720 [Sphingomonas sp. HF-S4]|uniref:Uncharacterized protein n=1 Tax=Sphingomonas agrestis TaxID=3080540 RepID=A0ABU3Y774_9SPHN|nr:hypothetical protein [Sphingomonas sp. HF-S4]MDV3457260.1 hypothetical protein [Sphingomonas sp. HF-S4]